MEPEFKDLKRCPFAGPYGSASFLSDPFSETADVDGKKGIVTGYFSAFNNVDSHNHVVEPGAFRKTIREWGPNGIDRVQHLLDHRWSNRIARILELSEDNKGLRYVSKFMKGHTLSDDTLIEIEAGVLREHSFGFDIMKWERDDDDILHLLELRLWEGSCVTWGANQQTPVVGVKSMQNDGHLFDRMVHQLRAMENAVMNGVTDERAEQLELQIADLKQSFRLLENALQTGEPGTPTPADEKPPTKDQVKLEIIRQLKIN